MAYEVLEPYIDDINEMMAAGESASAIAKALGIPDKRHTIQRYKKEFDLHVKVAATRAWNLEKSKPPEQRIAEGAVKIVGKRELIAKMMDDAHQLLSLKVGQPYVTAENEERTMSYGAAAALWKTGTDIGSTAIRLEAEIAGDDPGSRMAESFLELVQRANQRRADLERSDSMSG